MANVSSLHHVSSITMLPHHFSSRLASLSTDESVTENPLYVGSSGSMYELADCVIMFYHYCVHRTLVKSGVARVLVKETVRQHAAAQLALTEAQQQVW